MTTSKKEDSRKKSLARIGELFALKALVDCGYKNIKNLNDITPNEKFADLYCEIEGESIVISVKARNKYTDKKKLNSSYNLGKNSEDASNKAKFAEKKYKATAYWMGVQFDIKDYTIYFGRFTDLENKGGIPISKCMQGKVGQILVKKTHDIDWDYFTNQKQK
jgi:hypothetical protein